MSLSPILYIEDEENDVLFMRRALAESGIPNPLHVVPDGKQAIVYLRDARTESRPCFVLLDLNLPLVSGFEVLEWIREQPSLRDLPVFVLSSSNQAGDIERATQLGATSYAVKPTSPSKLVDVVREIQSKWHPQEHV